MQITSLAIDIVALVIIVICAAIYASRGFLAGAVGFVGTLVSLVAASVASTKLSPVVFERFLAPGLTEKAAESLAQTGVQNVADLAAKLLGFLPESMVRPIAESLGQNISLTAENAAPQLVQEVIAPLLLPLVAALIFIVVLVVLSVVTTVLGRMLTHVNRVPVLGGINKAAGGAMGVLVGVLWVVVAAWLVWVLAAASGESLVKEAAFEGSFVYKTLMQLKIITP